MYNIVVTSNQTQSTEPLFRLEEGAIAVVAQAEHEWDGHVVLLLGKNRFVNLTKPEGTSRSVYDYTFLVRPLRSTEALTLIKR